MNLKPFLVLICILISNLVHAQFDDFDDDDYSDDDYVARPSLYEVVKNDQGLYGLSRISDKKMMIPYKYSNISLDGTPYSLDPVYIEVYDSLNKAGIYSLKTNKIIVTCNYESISLEYIDFYPNDNEETYQFCGFKGESTVENKKLTSFFSPTGKLLASSEYKISLTPMGKYKTDTIFGYMEDLNDLSKTDSYTEYNVVGYFLYNLKTGNIIQKHDYKSILFNSYNTMIVVKNDAGKYGVVNCATGITLIENSYDSIKDSYLDFICYKDKMASVINFKGQVVIPAGSYDDISQSGWARYDKENPRGFCMTINKKWGCVNEKNQLILPVEFDWKFEYSDTMWVSKNHLWGSITSKGNIIVPFEYDTIITGSFYNYESYFDYILAKKKSKWGCLKQDGEILVPLEYEKPIEYYDTMWVAKNGKWGCIDAKMNQIFEFKFDTAVYSDFKYNTLGILCKKSGKDLQLDFHGNHIITHKGTLVEAVNNRDFGLFDALISDATPEDKGRALFEAIYDNNIEMFRLLLKSGPDLKFAYDNKPPIYHVALLVGKFGHEATFKEMITSLVAAGADPNQTGFFGESPLEAYFSSNYETTTEQVQLLLNAGCKVNKAVFKKLSYSNASKETKALLKQYERN
jgi:hypothetical protein